MSGHVRPPRSPLKGAQGRAAVGPNMSPAVHVTKWTNPGRFGHIGRFGHREVAGGHMARPLGEQSFAIQCLGPSLRQAGALLIREISP